MQAAYRALEHTDCTARSVDARTLARCDRMGWLTAGSTPVMVVDSPPRTGRTGSALADVSASCRAIRASQLRLLFRAPSHAERAALLRCDVDLPTGETMRVRIGLTVTPFEIYRGIRLLDSAEVDCRLENASSAEAWLQAVEQSPTSTRPAARVLWRISPNGPRSSVRRETRCECDHRVGVQRGAVPGDTTERRQTVSEPTIRQRASPPVSWAHCQGLHTKRSARRVARRPRREAGVCASPAASSRLPITVDCSVAESPTTSVGCSGWRLAVAARRKCSRRAPGLATRSQRALASAHSAHKRSELCARGVSVSKCASALLRRIPRPSHTCTMR